MNSREEFRVDIEMRVKLDDPEGLRAVYEADDDWSGTFEEWVREAIEETTSVQCEWRPYFSIADVELISAL